MASDSEKLAKIDAKYTDLARVLRLEDVPTIDIATLQKWLEDEARCVCRVLLTHWCQLFLSSRRPLLPRLRQAENVVLVDVRSREEAEVSTLPGALWCGALRPHLGTRHHR